MRPILAQAPETPSGPGAGPQVHDVAGAHGPGPAAVSTTRWPASSMALASPVSSSPARVTRTVRPSVAQRRRTSSARARRPSAVVEEGAPGGQGARAGASRSTCRSTGCAVPPDVVQAGAPGPRRTGPGHVDPDADHHGGQRLARRTRPRPGSRPAWRRPTSRSLGHFSTGSTPATARQASAAGQRHRPGAEVDVVRRRSRGGAGRRPAGSPPAATPSAGRAAPARPSGGRPPRPARRGHPGGPGHARSVLVESTSSSRRMSHSRPTWQTPYGRVQL